LDCFATMVMQGDGHADWWSRKVWVMQSEGRDWYGSWQVEYRDRHGSWQVEDRDRARVVTGMSHGKSRIVTRQGS